MEIELVPIPREELTDLPRYVRYNWVRDGSLTPGGQEMVLNPLCGDQFTQGITKLAESLTRNGAGVDGSCGYHVHVQAQDYAVLDLRRLLTVYCRVEREIFRVFTTPERIGSRFCKPYTFDEDWWKRLWELKSLSEIREMLISTLYPKLAKSPKGFRGFPGVRGHKYEDCRYHGLNLHSWFQRNTIEWRHSQGTLDPERLVGWALFCGWFVEICCHLTDAEALKIATLEDFVEGQWKKPTKILQLPEDVKAWVRSL